VLSGGDVAAPVLSGGATGFGAAGTATPAVASAATPFTFRSPRIVTT
jgi:hypothetical protein